MGDEEGSAERTLLLLAAAADEAAGAIADGSQVKFGAEVVVMRGARKREEGRRSGWGAIDQLVAVD